MKYADRNGNVQKQAKRETTPVLIRDVRWGNEWESFL